MDKKVKKKLIKEYMELTERIMNLEEVYGVDEFEFPWELRKLQLEGMHKYQHALEIRLAYAKVDWRDLVSLVHKHRAID